MFSQRGRGGPPKRPELYLGAVAAARPGPPVPHPLRPSSAHGPTDGVLGHGRVSDPAGGPRGPRQVCAPHPGLLRGKRASLLLSQGDSGCSDGLLKCSLVLLFIEVKLT